MRRLCQREGVTLFIALLAGFKALLHRYTGQDDLVVGSGIANRGGAETEGLIGFFVNSLRTRVSGGLSFRELVGRVKDTALGAYDHQDLPFEKLVEELQPDRDLSQNPLFQVVFVVQNASKEALELPGLTVRPFEREITFTHFDLEVQVWEERDRIVAGFSYNTDLFTATTIERMGQHYLSPVSYTHLTLPTIYSV